MLPTAHHRCDISSKDAAFPTSANGSRPLATNGIPSTRFLHALIRGNGFRPLATLERFVLIYFQMKSFTEQNVYLLFNDNLTYILHINLLGATPYFILDMHIRMIFQITFRSARIGTLIAVIRFVHSMSKEMIVHLKMMNIDSFKKRSTTIAYVYQY